MKVLMISTDRKIFDETSAVRARMVDYADLFERLEIIVFAKKGGGFTTTQIGPNGRAYSTQSLTPLGYVWDAIKIGRKILTADKSRDWVVTCQDSFETGLVGWFLAKTFGVKLNLQLHTDVFSPFFAKESLKNKIRVWLAKKLLPKADSVRVVSERIKKSLAFLPLKIEPIVLPIFVEESSREITLKENLRQRYSQFDFIIWMASRLTREKNFSLALSALVGAVKTNPQLGLVIVGDGPERGKIEREISRLKLNQNVILEKWNNNLSDYYQTADLFLLSSDYEGYGRTLVEAAQAGCPILTTEIGIVGEILDETNSLICPVGDRDCLTQKIAWAMTNCSLLKTKAEKLSCDLSEKVITDKAVYLERYKKSLN